jgi:hypothetical protein
VACDGGRRILGLCVIVELCSWEEKVLVAFTEVGFDSDELHSGWLSERHTVATGNMETI